MRRPRAPRRAEPLLRLREPIDVLCAIPFLIGYHPSDCAVAIGLRDKQLYFTLRLDLPPEGSTPDEIEDMVAAVCQRMREHRVNGALFVGYGPDDRVRPLLRGMRRHCREAGIRVNESLRAEGGRFWSYLCRNPRCCPAEGTPYDPHAGVIAAEATLAGCTALPDFASYAAQVDRAEPTGGTTGAARRAAERLIGLLRQARDESDAARRLLAAGASALDDALARTRAAQRLDDDDIAWLSTLTMHIGFRDACWTRMTGEHSDVDVHRSLWLDVMRRCESDLLPAPACLFAIAAYISGDAKLASLAVDRVEVEDADYSLGRLLRHVIDNGVPPAILRDRPPTDWSAVDRPRVTLPQGGRRRDGWSPSGSTPKDPCSGGQPRRGLGGRRRSSSRRAGSRRG